MKTQDGTAEECMVCLQLIQAAMLTYLLEYIIRKSRQLLDLKY